MSHFKLVYPSILMIFITKSVLLSHLLSSNTFSRLTADISIAFMAQTDSSTVSSTSVSAYIQMNNSTDTETGHMMKISAAEPDPPYCLFYCIHSGAYITHNAIPANCSVRDLGVLCLCF